MSSNTKPVHPVEGGHRLTLKTPAKVNLFLKVTGRRPDGYHTLTSLFCGVDLYDTLELRFSGSRLTVSCSDPTIPTDAKNLALAAAERFYQRVPQAAGMGLHIHLEKRIPVGAGLGGGSSNAAGVLQALNTIHGEPLSAKELCALGLDLGADVPFFLFGRPAWATGIGERLAPVDHLPVMDLLIVYPKVSVSTATVFEGLNLGLTNPPKQHRNSPFKEGEFCLSRDLVNDLERVTLSRYPEVLEAKQALLLSGARGALMTGSGSAVFGVFKDPKEVQEAAVALMKAHSWQFFGVKLLTDYPYMRFVT